MCGGVKFTDSGKEQTVYFPQPRAELPLQLCSGDMEKISWGRRREEQGDLPIGGWARQDSIDKGVWEKYQPRPVQIMVHAFMEKDKNKVTHWFDLSPGQHIQGLLATLNDERRVYVVTITSDNPIHDRWPKIMTK